MFHNARSSVSPTRRAVLVICVTLYAIGAGAAAESVKLRTSPSALLTIDQNRTTVVDRVVSDWGHALAASASRMSPDELRNMLMSMRADQLLAASLAGTLEGLRTVIANALTTNAPVASGSIHAKAVGDTGDDLVYTPVVPCRILDTRNVGGVFANGETRNYHAYLTSGTFATQGGAASNCGIPANPAAVALNITVLTNAAGSGFLTAWPYNVGRPLAATLNYYAAGQQVGNGALVPLCLPNCAAEFSIYSSGAVNVITDIVGYFKAPGAALQHYVDNGDGTVTDNTTGLMWEKKLASSNPVCTNANQASRDARCEQNTYNWALPPTDPQPSGTLFSDFLEKLNDLKTPNDGTATPCFAGHCDWRLPTIGELRSILLTPFPNCPAIPPCIDPIFEPTQTSLYWSSSVLPGASTLVWRVNFAFGQVADVSKDASFYARAVRGGR